MKYNDLFESEGGHLYALEEAGPDGYPTTVCCVEMEIGQVPFIVSQSRPLAEKEVESLMLAARDVYDRSSENQDLRAVLTEFLNKGCDATTCGVRHPWHGELVKKLKKLVFFEEP